MSRHFVSRISIASCVAAFGVASNAAALEMSGAITACHDPSRIIESNGVYTIYSTGNLVNVRTSSDLVTWSWASGVFSSMPNWMTTIANSVGATLDNIWAPDVIFTSNHYLNYYSRDIGSGTSEHAVCGVATATSPAGPWTDQGKVLDVVVASAFYRVIDPAPIVDQSGQLWIAVGSFGYASTDGYNNGGIRLFKTDPSTGKLVTSSDAGTNIAGAWIEAPFVRFHDGYYYLFFNQGQCCKGLDSNYYVRVGRSNTINGAYTDLNGDSLRVSASGGTLFMGLDFPSNYDGSPEASPTPKANKGDIGRELGPGHVGVSELGDGIERLTYHFYDTATSNGEPTLGLTTVIWGIDGWPRPGWSLPDGLYAIGTRLNADSGASAALFLDSASGTPALAAFTNATSQHWSVTRVAANRQTVVSERGGLALTGGEAVSLSTAVAASSAQRWFIEQTNDMSFRLLNDGSKAAALQVPASESSAGTAAQLGRYGVNLSNQRWFITPVGAYRICSKYSGLCIQPASSAAGANLNQQTSSSSTLQYWRFIPTGDGYTRMVNASTGYAMAVKASSTADAAAVVQEADNGSANQQFSIDVLTDSSMRLVPKVSGKALEVAGASKTTGSAIQQNTWTHTMNQQFVITAVTLAAGGTTGTGGTSSTGGAPSTGGVTAAGGTTSTGGAPSGGGAASTGGTSNAVSAVASGGLVNAGGSHSNGTATFGGSGGVGIGGALLGGNTGAGGSATVNSVLTNPSASGATAGLTGGVSGSTAATSTGTQTSPSSTGNQGGCGCRTAPVSSRRTLLACAALTGLLVRARRRRRS